MCVGVWRKDDEERRFRTLFDSESDEEPGDDFGELGRSRRGLSTFVLSDLLGRVGGEGGGGGTPAAPMAFLCFPVVIARGACGG